MTLLAALRAHGPIIEADVQREYGVDLSGLWRGELTLRRARLLIEGLPHDCRTAYALAGEELAAAAGWSLTNLLLGRIADELAIYRWQWESAHIDPKKSRPRKQPPSVLPELRPAAPVTELRLVSPHRLGGFVHDTTEEVTPHGD